MAPVAPLEHTGRTIEYENAVPASAEPGV